VVEGVRGMLGGDSALGDPLAGFGAALGLAIATITLATIGLAGITAIGMGGVAAAIALRTGSLSLLQSLFPFMFVMLFTSPAFFPQNLLTPVLQDVSVYNPLTYVVEGVRGLLNGDPSLGNPWQGLAAAVGLAVGATFIATLALKERLRRL